MVGKKRWKSRYQNWDNHRFEIFLDGITRCLIARKSKEGEVLLNKHSYREINIDFSVRWYVNKGENQGIKIEMIIYFLMVLEDVWLLEVKIMTQWNQRKVKYYYIKTVVEINIDFSVRW